MVREYSSSSSSPRELSREECEIVTLWANQECDRICPQNRGGYFAAVFQRKASEVIADRSLQTQLQSVILASATMQLDAPVEHVAGSAVAAEAMASGLATGRRERAELLAKMVLEQSVDAPW